MFARELIHDWNQSESTSIPSNRHIGLDDETLRDGLQSPSITAPPLEKKIAILHLMNSLGIDTADIGLPGAGGTHAADVEALAREIDNNNLRIRPNCAARTHRNDIKPIVEISQRVGIPIEACTFLLSSPIRSYVDDKSLDDLLRLTEKAVTEAVQEGLPVMYVTEDTTRATPETIYALYATAIQCGARAVCVCDTVGHARPEGARAVVKFVRKIIEEQGEAVRLDWHGHQDRGLALINSIAAIEAGADQIHGTALGMGERVGNTSMDQLMVNLKLMGLIDNDVSLLRDYCETAASSCGWTIPNNYPVFGRDAFRTATGVHADAIIKAFDKGGSELADNTYSGVPASLFGLHQAIDIGPMSGKSNIIFNIKARGYEPTEERVEHMFEYAKRCSNVLSEDEIITLIDGS